MELLRIFQIFPQLVFVQFIITDKIRQHDVVLTSRLTLVTEWQFYITERLRVENKNLSHSNQWTTRFLSDFFSKERCLIHLMVLTCWRKPFNKIFKTMKNGLQ